MSFGGCVASRHSVPGKLRPNLDDKATAKLSVSKSMELVLLHFQPVNKTAKP